MLFTHDTEISLNATAALVNTARGTHQGAADELTDIAALDEFIAHWQWSGSRTRDQAELDAVRALRPRLAQLWQITEDEAVLLVNQLLREASALPQLVRHDGWAYHIHATPPEAPLADRMKVDAAMALADVIRAGELARLRHCAADDCDDVLVDLSKNRSRRFCGLTCANRVNVAAYRLRRSAS
jgi:predicted RNA-binding Zn ribbon-like protein